MVECQFKGVGPEVLTLSSVNQSEPFMIFYLMVGPTPAESITRIAFRHSSIFLYLLDHDGVSVCGHANNIKLVTLL